MSRVTNDLFDISELFHHGPEDVVISLIKFIGTMVILLNIHTGLALCAAASLPFMLVFAYVYNGKLKEHSREIVIVLLILTHSLKTAFQVYVLSKVSEMKMLRWESFRAEIMHFWRVKSQHIKSWVFITLVWAFLQH